MIVTFVVSRADFPIPQVIHNNISTGPSNGHLYRHTTHEIGLRNNAQEI